MSAIGTHYLNTDLDLVSNTDLRGLAHALAQHGVVELHVTPCEDGLWRANFEALGNCDTLQATVDALVGAVERLGQDERSVWDACVSRILDVGVECGSDPYSHVEWISEDLVRRAAALHLSLRFTVYRCEDHRR